MTTRRLRNLLPALVLLCGGCLESGGGPGLNAQDASADAGAQDPVTRQSKQDKAKGDQEQDKAKADQDKAKADQDKKERIQKLPEQMKALFDEYGIEVDLKARSVTIPVVVNAPSDAIEYLLIHRSGKTHEAILVTQAKPSVLNAALILIEVEPGRNFILKEKQPRPTEEEFKRGVSLYDEVEPKGEPLWMTVTMTTKDGRQKTVPVEDLVYDIRNDHPVTDTRWVYLGSRMAQMYRGEPPVFMADMEGNLVSTIYMGAGSADSGQGNQLVTMVHEHARDQENWWITEACPGPGTKMKFTFHLRKPAAVVERDKRIAEIKAKGKAKSLPDPQHRRVTPHGAEPGTRPTSRQTGGPEQGGDGKKGRDGREGKDDRDGRDGKDDKDGRDGKDDKDG